MREEDISRIQEHLKTRDLMISQTPFGHVAIKGNWTPPSDVTSLNIDGLELEIAGRTLHERALVIQRNIPIRSHEEESQEIVTNIGVNPITYISDPGQPLEIMPGNTIYSVKGNDGFHHGFSVERRGILYVAKALHPEFAEGGSFRVPENSYNGQ